MLINKHRTKSGKESVTLEDVALKLLYSSLSDKGDAEVKISCHCKLTVALNALNINPTPKPIEIGVPRRICWLCQKHLEKLRSHHKVRILISDYQGKCHAGWRLPPGTPGPIEEGVRQLIDGEINAIRETVLKRKRSDFFFPADRKLHS